MIQLTRGLARPRSSRLLESAIPLLMAATSLLGKFCPAMLAVVVATQRHSAVAVVKMVVISGCRFIFHRSALLGGCYRSDILWLIGELSQTVDLLDLLHNKSREEENR